MIVIPRRMRIVVADPRIEIGRGYYKTIRMGVENPGCCIVTAAPPGRQKKGRGMVHLRALTRIPVPAEQGSMDPLETVIIVLLSVFFRTWDNFMPVLQGLQKFYSKTP